MSSEENREISVDDYRSLKSTIDQFDKTKRIFILFSGSKDSNGISWFVNIDSHFHFRFLLTIIRRCPDCVTAEKPIEEALKSSFPSNGIFIQCPVGSKEKSSDENEEKKAKFIFNLTLFLVGKIRRIPIVLILKFV